MNPSGQSDERNKDAEPAMDAGSSERRRGPDRRIQQIPVAVERRSGRDRREEAARRNGEDGASRRRMVDPTTCEKEYGEEEMEFMLAMDQYKRANRRPFPTWSEVLEVLKALGYRKVGSPTAIPGLPIPRGNGPVDG